MLETVILWPVVLLLFLGALQWALYFHARNVAMKAGEEGLRQARAQYGNTALGTAATYAYIAQTGPTTLRTPAVVMIPGAREIRVHITGEPIRLLPFMPVTVTVDQSQPVERITTPGEPW